MNNTLASYYASHSENGWRIIHQALPICNDKPTYAEVLEVAHRYGIKLQPDYYDGTIGAWRSISELYPNQAGRR